MHPNKKVSLSLQQLEQIDKKAKQQYQQTCDYLIKLLDKYIQLGADLTKRSKQPVILDKMQT